MHFNQKYGKKIHILSIGGDIVLGSRQARGMYDHLISKNTKKKKRNIKILSMPFQFKKDDEAGEEGEK